MAKLVAKDAIAKTGVCPITYEPYSELDSLYVGWCGHVFSEAVASQARCPLCRCETLWTPVRKEILSE